MTRDGARFMRDVEVPLLSANHIYEAAAKLRASRWVDPVTAARSLGKVLSAWRDHDFAPRRSTVTAIAAAWGYSEPLIEASFDALLTPFDEQPLAAYAASIARTESRDGADSEILGMVIPGNLPGAGLHEVLIGLLSGKALMLKTSASEPFFFASLARTIQQFDETLSKRLAVFNWDRSRGDLTVAMRANCVGLVVFGDDETVQHLKDSNISGSSGSVGGGPESHPLKAGFGLRFSGGYVGEEVFEAEDGGHQRALIIDGLARDVSLFEQMGCLSPHHIFVAERSRSEAASDGTGTKGNAYHFAAGLAAAIERLTAALPPPNRLELETAAAIRRVREAARWRMLGGESVALWEGSRLGWTVIYDEGADFAASPGFRTVTVSPVADTLDLERRLAPVADRLEAFAATGSSAELGGVKRCLSEHGVSYVCTPGRMQSPPLTWRHGGGAFLDAMAGHRRV
jgi:acyl-CoA reductase LuxC